jgi:uncharacterized small protein (DUF1192 family)
MRINKTAATDVLERNVTELDKQIDRCDAEIDKFNSIHLAGFSGKAPLALISQIRGQVPVLHAYKVFFESLREAEKDNASEIGCLPETSPGVLDTDEAQDRIGQAREEIRRLEDERDETIDNLNRASVLCSVITIDDSAVSAYYSLLIEAQNLIIHHYESIPEAYDAYGVAAQRIYEGVDRAPFDTAQLSVSSYNATHSWGVRGLEAYLPVDQAKLYEGFKTVGDLLTNDMTLKKSDMQSVGLRVGAVKGTLSGARNDITAKAGTFGKFKLTGEGKPEAKAGAYIQGEYTWLHGKAALETNGAKVDAEGKLLTGAAKGELGGTLFDDEGNIRPSLYAGAEASGSFVELSGNAQAGDKHNNAHINGNFKIGTAEAKANARIDTGGVTAKAEAGAYAVKGELSGGVTVLGIKLDVKAEGGAGGASVKAGGEVTRHSAGFEIGAGAGVGAGLSVNIDWGGFPAAVKDYSVKCWNSVFH